MNKSHFPAPSDYPTKWERHTPLPQEDPVDPYAHIREETKKVIHRVSLQKGVPFLSETSDITEFDITISEGIIIRNLINLPQKNELIDVCRHPTAEGFLALADPLIKELKKSIDEEIDLAHILFGVRRKLGITIV